MTTRKIFRPEQPIEVHIDDHVLVVKIASGRILRTPLEWYPWLANATPEQAANVELSALSIYWPDFDDGIDIDWLIEKEANMGIASSTPRSTRP